mgnify:CR=1 FL=1
MISSPHWMQGTGAGIHALQSAPDSSMRRVNCFCTCVVQVVRSSLGARVTEYDFPSRLPLAVPSTVTAPDAKLICTRSTVISTVTVFVRAIGRQQGLRGFIPGVFGFFGLAAFICATPKRDIDLFLPGHFGT